MKEADSNRFTEKAMYFDKVSTFLVLNDKLLRRLLRICRYSESKFVIKIIP